MSININQFAQLPVRGALDLQIMKSGVLQGIVSPNQATALKAGDPVKLDTANTTPVPWFLGAAQGDTIIGNLVFDEKKASPAANDTVQVTFFGGPVMWLTSSGTVNPGGAVEDATGGSGASVQAKTSNPTRGFALDPGTNGNLFRVVLLRVIS